MGLPTLIRSGAVVGLITAFCLPALGMVAKSVLGGNSVSVAENRMLAEPPTFAGDVRAFTADMDAYFEDGFGGRMPLIRIARKTKDNLGEDPPNVVVGDEDWLYLGQLAYRDEFEGQGQWDAEQVERWSQSLSDINAELAARDVPFAAFIAVDKARAYPEYLPRDWKERPRRFRTALHARDADGRTGLIDAAPLVANAKAQGAQVFFKRDTHWTSNASHDLALAILDQLDPEGSRPRYAPGAPVVSAFGRKGDLEILAGFNGEREPETALLPFPPFGPGGRIGLLPASETSPHRGQFETLRIDGTGEDGRLVIVGDSFADTMLGHLLPSYAEIIRIHHGAHIFDVSLDDVLAYEPTAVLFGTAERQAVRKQRPFAPLTP